jgi:hypothetical protein
MVWLAERECSECGIIQPLEALNLYTERRIAGWATGGRGSSPSRPVELHLCTDCTGLRIRVEKQARFWAITRPMLVVGAIAISIVSIAALIPTGSYGDSESDTPVLNLEGAEVVLAPPSSKHAAAVISSGDPAWPAQTAPAGGDVASEQAQPPFDRAAPIGSIAAHGAMSTASPGAHQRPDHFRATR